MHAMPDDRRVAVVKNRIRFARSGVERRMALAACNGTPEAASIFRGLVLASSEVGRGHLDASTIADVVRRVGIQPAGSRAVFGEDARHWIPPSDWEAAGVRRDKYGTPAVGLWQVPAQFGCLASRVDALLRGRRRVATLTVGTWSGWTDVVMAGVLQRERGRVHHHYTFDPVDLVAPCVKRLFERHNVSFAPRHWGEATAGSVPRSLDFCFIDGAHNYASARHDFQLLRRRCSIIAFHDILNPRVGMRSQPQLWRDLTNGPTLPGMGERRARPVVAHFDASNCTQTPRGGSVSFGIGVLVRRGERRGLNDVSHHI